MRKVLAFGLLMSSSVVARADISSPKIIAFASGACSVSVAGTDVGCEGKGIHTLLLNGHHLFDFTTKDVAIVGFAGTRVDRFDGSKPVLWVEHVYISNNQYDADGQCSYVTDTNDDKTFRKVECRALLRDGRKVTAELDGRSDGKPSSMTQQAGATTDPEGNPESTCEKTIRLHGMLTRAQFQCGYRSYNTALTDAARQCNKEVGEAKMEQRLKDGFHDFDANEQERGHKAICAELLKRFSSFVRR